MMWLDFLLLTSWFWLLPSLQLTCSIFFWGGRGGGGGRGLWNLSEEVPPPNDELKVLLCPQLCPAGVKPRPALLLDWLEVTPPLCIEGLVTVGMGLVTPPLALLGMPWPRPEVGFFPLLLDREVCLPLPAELDPPSQVFNHWHISGI